MEGKVPDEPDILTASEAAEYLRMDYREFLSVVVPQIRVIRFKPGGKIRVPRASLLDWVAKNAQRH